MSKENKSELLLALEQLEREKNIKREDVFKTITDSLVSALRKYFGKTAQIMAGIDPETGEMAGFLVKKVADAHHGSISFTVTDGDKVTFDLFIPD